MTDKTRQRQRSPLRAPPGALPNWVVALLAVALVTVGALLTRVG